MELSLNQYYEVNLILADQPYAIVWLNNTELSRFSSN